MNHFFRLIILTLGGLIANIVIAASLSSEAQERGISATCSAYLGQLEESYDLKVVRTRIEMKIKLKPDWYKWNGKKISTI